MRTTLLAALALAAAPLACPAPALAQDVEAGVDDGAAAVRNAPPLTPERVRRFIAAYGGFMRVMGGMDADKLRRQAQALPARMAAGMIAEQALEKGLSLLPPQAQMVIGLGRGLLGMFGVQTSPMALMQGSMNDGEMGKI